MVARSRRGDFWALLIVFVLGVPLIYGMAVAFADGELRRRQTPLVSLLGSRSYEALVKGEPTPQNYLGDDRLAPDFTLPTVDGGTWKLSDHRGKVVVMNFWTTTCQPCVEEMPSLITLSRILKDRDDVELVAVTVDRDPETVRTVVPEDAPLTVLMDPDRKVVGDEYGTRLFPETWVIDPDGVIRLRVDGARDWASSVALNVFDSYR